MLGEWPDQAWLQSSAQPLPDGLKALPRGHGVYAFLGLDGALLYVGKSVKLRSRARSYFGPQGGHTTFTARLKAEAKWVAHRACGSELEALLVEARLIARLLPNFNLKGRRFHHYPFLKIPAEPFPRLLVTREVVPDGARYLGPFPGQYGLAEALEALRPVLRFRDCEPLPSKACFAASVGRCDAPCVGGIAEEAYAERVAWVVDLLEGRGEGLVEELRQRMQAAAAAQAFEVAALWRDRLGRITPWLQRHRALAAAVDELDVLAVLPDQGPDTWLWLLIRRGRLCWTRGGIRVGALGRAKQALTKALAAPAPSLLLAQAELDEVNLLAAWLHRHPQDAALLRLQGQSVEDLALQAQALMQAGPEARKPQAPEAVGL